MKVLVFSDYNPFAYRLIARLAKEGQQVYLVTGNEKKDQRKSRHVFQEYRLSYQNEKLGKIIQSIHADKVIIAGKRAKLADYIAAITNIMLALEKTTIQDLTFISDLAIFDGNSESVITEETVPKPKSDRSKAQLLGEEIVKKYAKDAAYQLNIIRYSEIYGSEKGDYLSNNALAVMLEAIIAEEKMTLEAQKKHALVYIDDAVDAVYKVLTKKHLSSEKNIYHLATEPYLSFNEKDLLALIQKKLPEQAVIDWTVDEENHPSADFPIDKIKTLDYQAKYKVKDQIEPLYQVIKASKEDHLIIDNKKESLISRLFHWDPKVKDKILPYLENIVFFIFLNLFIYLTRSMAFHQVIDLYLLYTVVISLIYGFEQSVFTIILSVLAKVYITIYTNIAVLSLTNEYLYMWILFIFTIGTLVGYLKEQYKIKYANVSDEKDYLEEQLKTVKEINEVNLEIKDLYEERLLNYQGSFGTIYEIASELDLVEPPAIVFRAIRVIQKIMRSDEVSIYAASGNNRFYRLLASSADPERGLKSSLRRADYEDLFDKMNRQETYVNKELATDYPMMATGVYQNDHLQMIIMIWSLPFDYNNLYQMNVLEVTTKLIESKLNAAYNYMSSLSSSYNLKYNNMRDKDSFEKILALYQTGFEEGIVQYSLLTLQKKATQTEDDFIDLIKANVRETDYIYQSGKQAKILLSNTSSEDAHYVIDRFKKAGLDLKEGGQFV